MNASHKIKEKYQIFFDWILQNYDINILKKHGIIEIGSGNGELTLLFLKQNIPVTIIDPNKPLFLKKSSKTYQQIKDKVKFNHFDKLFDNDILKRNEELNQIFNECSLIIALHCCQAAEPVIDLCLQNNKNFCVVPCCVFPNQMKKYLNGKRVIEYKDFIKYLKRKDQNINRIMLPFRGKNRVVFINKNK